MPLESPAGTQCVEVERASFYLSKSLCEKYLSGAESVALLLRDREVLITPLMPGSAGGLLLKLRNAQGDRVIHAQEFFRAHAYAESFERIRCPVCWDDQAAALRVSNLPAD